MDGEELKRAAALNDAWDAAVGGRVPAGGAVEERFVVWLHRVDVAPMPEGEFLARLRAQVVEEAAAPAVSSSPRPIHRRRTSWWVAAAVAAAVLLAALWGGDRLLPSGATASIVATVGVELQIETPEHGPRTTQTAAADAAPVISWRGAW